jgi:hypothetical protein
MPPSLDVDVKDRVWTLWLSGETRKNIAEICGIGGTFDGPYYPQDEALMYVFKVKNYEWLNQCGRRFLKRVDEDGIKITPTRYEVAITPEEFWGK